MRLYSSTDVMPNSLQDRALNDLENEPLDEKKDIPSIILPPVSHITSSTYIFSLCAALNSCNLGYDIGVNTSAGPLLQSSLSLSTAQLELFMGSLSLMAIVGSFFASFFADRYGRLPGFIFASLGFIIGLVILCLATSFVTLMIGRALIGMGVGFGLAMDPLYIAEISPQSHRGKLVTFSETAINVGIVLGFAAGFLSEEKFGGWRVMYGLGLIMPIFLILVIVCRLMPESPRWLISQRRHTEAQLVLEKIYPPGYPISQLVQHISETIQWEKQQQYSSVRQNPTWIQGLCQQITEKWSLIRHSSPAVRRMLIVGLGAATTQQLVGVDAIQYYLIFILQEAGIPPGQRQTLILVALGFVKMIVIVLAGYLFDRIGRRSLMFASLAGMGLALCTISINFLTGGHYWITITALAVYLGFFSLGMGPGAWLIPSETFSLTIRANAMSMATFLNRVTSAVMASSCLSLATFLTWPGFFFFLAFICVLVYIFYYVYLPETKGKSLEEMNKYFVEITGNGTVVEAEMRPRPVHDSEIS